MVHFLNNHSREMIVLGFVLLGILCFASLHTFITLMSKSSSFSDNMKVATTGTYNANNQTSIFSLEKCWRSALMSSPSVEQAWRTDKLVRLRADICDSSGLDYAAQLINSKFKYYNNNESGVDSIRRDQRFVIEGQCGSATNDYSKTKNKAGSLLQKSLSTAGIPAGTCISTVSNKVASAQENTSLRKKTLFQCLPSFIIAGAMKSGTGELMKWLELHPYLKRSQAYNGRKENHFFSNFRTSDYENPAAMARNYSYTFPFINEKQIELIYTFEKSPDYMRSHRAMEAIARALPGIKIVLLIRNPVVRAVSEFNHHCRHGRYIKLLQSVRLSVRTGHRESSLGNTNSTKGKDAMLYPAGTVLRIVDRGQENSLFQIDPSQLSRRAYIVLPFPCLAKDMMQYFSRARTLSRSSQGNGNFSAFPDEITNGFYSSQIRRIYELFQAKDILLLSQEEMFRDTFSTLKRTESFLSLPCFDYSKFAELSSSNQPPKRKSSVSHTQNIKESLQKLLGISSARKGGEALLRECTSSFRSQLTDLFVQDTAALSTFLKSINIDFPFSSWGKLATLTE